MLAFLFKVWGLARPYRARLFLGVLTGVISGLLSPLLIATVMFVYGAVFPTANSAATGKLPMKVPSFVQNWFGDVRAGLESGLHAHQWAVYLLIAAIPCVMLLRGALGYLNVYFLQWTASRTIADLRTRLFAHLLNLSAGFYTENSSGQLISRVINDTQALQTILSNATSVIVRDPVTLIGLLGYLFYQQPRLTLISLVALPVCVIPVAIFSRKVRRNSKAMQTQSAELTQIMSEAFTGHRIVKAYNLESIAAEKFRATARKSVGHYMRIIRAMEIPGPLIEFFGSCGVAFVLLYLINHSKASPNPIDFLQLVGSIFAMYAPMKNLTRLQNQLVQARAASERAFALLVTETTVPEPVQPRLLRAESADIQFDRVNFSYGEKIALHEINLQIKSGQLVALVGASGSGKTTLSNLLLRFYDPQRGAIKIGGADLREFSTRDLRNQIAVVTQETVLFNDTIRQNIELGRPGATNEEIIAAARHAHAHQFISEKSEGYETIIGEKGVMLSGGQRQRLAIARAVLRNAPILILDEATNALDTESERAVQTALDELMQGRTTLCIAHRLSTILHADLIVVLDQGRIVETGRHEELVARGGVYQKLYELQFRE
ncbi:MAG TPA: ABC transporter transmembrane domain-containing protein [Verrucomicrobiae bacterium]|nr:ABC transporter transmembrane domain-containing protein [Verrucomicrobiae bacterium]